MISYFEPTGRLIMSIGKDLIKDLPAALVELVKNSYDADATYVKIIYEKTESQLKILVEDDGHGMDLNTVLNVWMVPSTDYKLKKGKSPKGRIYQGRKGLGRYAVSLLGNKLKLITIKDQIQTVVDFDWNNFNSEKKLKDIPINYNTSSVSLPNGTILEIINEKENHLAEEINENDVDKIEKELSKLLSYKDNFKIIVCYNNFFIEKEKNICKEISQQEFSDAFHYRLYGKITSDFSYKLTYINNYTKEKKVFSDKFSFSGGKAIPCGNIEIDYRVYDKDPSGIEIIMNFVNSSRNIRYSKSEIKNLLKEQSGISIFRNGFRIRPYGESEFDWLSLNSKRVQNPSMSIGSEQIFGRVYIGSEEDSGLKEKSARDGLYENSNFHTLIRLAEMSLAILERERFKYRQQPNKKVFDAVTRLFDFSHINQNINKAFENSYKNIKKSPGKIEEYFFELNQEVTGEIKKLEQEKESDFLEVKERIAIYQKHTTLGNVISVVLHEGRKPLSWYTNKLPQMERKIKKLLKNQEIIERGYTDLSNDISKLENEARRMSSFFSRLDPLSSNKRKKKTKINLEKHLKAVIEIFEGIAKEKNIFIELKCNEEIFLEIIEEDLYMALTNILENAIFWVNHSTKKNKIIKINLYTDNDETIIEIIDNGPGIPLEDIKENLLFYPGYSRKNTVQEENGTGLGLSIAGEAIQRNNGTLEAIESSVGAFFRILIKNRGKYNGED